ICRSGSGAPAVCASAPPSVAARASKQDALITAIPLRAIASSVTAPQTAQSAWGDDLRVTQLRFFGAMRRRKAAALMNSERRRGRFMQRRRLPEFRDDFRELMQPFARAVGADEPVIAKPRHRAAADIGRVHDNIHVFLDRHWLVVADQRPLDQVVALAVAVQALLLGPAVLAHEFVIGGEYVLAGSAGLEQGEVEFPCFQREGVFVLHLLRRLADHAGAAELCVHPAGPGVLYQKRDRVTFLDDAILIMALRELRWFAGRHRGAQIDAVLAAVTLAVALREGCDIPIAH